MMNLYSTLTIMKTIACFGYHKNADYKDFESQYPILFRDQKLPADQSCMHWGIECPSGWKDILTCLCEKLEFYNICFGQIYGFKIIADQIKEKFGTLTFYYHIETDENCIVKSLTWFIKKCEWLYGKITNSKLVNFDKVDKDQKPIYPKLQKFKAFIYWLICKCKTENVKRKSVINYFDHQVDLDIKDAREDSAFICCVCGYPLNEKTRVQSEGWIHYFCSQCYEEEIQKRKEWNNDQTN